MVSGLVIGCHFLRFFSDLFFEIIVLLPTCFRLIGCGKYKIFGLITYILCLALYRAYNLLSLVAFLASFFSCRPHFCSQSPHDFYVFIHCRNRVVIILTDRLVQSIHVAGALTCLWLYINLSLCRILTSVVSHSLYAYV